jgi:cytidylate kinase
MKAIEALVDQQIKRWELERNQPQQADITPLEPGPVITISRQRGSGGSLVASRLAELTGFAHFNREIIDQISREIGIQKRMVKSLDESVRSGFQLWVDGILRGRIIDTSDYMQSLVKIIGAISKHGKAIIVGRGANFITDKQTTFNVRIVADESFRINSLVERRGLSREAAMKEITENDHQRRKFIQSHFDRNIDDPAAYDMIINSSYIDVDQLAGIILSSFPLKLFKNDK